MRKPDQKARCVPVLLIAQVVFALVLFVALLALGMQIFGTGHINADVILPWAYTAAAGWCGAWICLVIRLCTALGKRRKSDEQGIQRADK